MTTELARLDVVSVAVLAFVTAQRLAELIYARRNEARLKALGGQEHGAGHYAWIVTLHTAWLIGLWLLAASTRPDSTWLLAFIVLQCLRLWVLVTLGRRWTTRIIVLPGAPLISSGPYRLLAHPNYAVVAAEIFVLPMAYGLLVFALLFSGLNASVLAVRIRAEERALRDAVIASRRSS